MIYFAKSRPTECSYGAAGCSKPAYFMIPTLSNRSLCVQHAKELLETAFKEAEKEFEACKLDLEQFRQYLKDHPDAALE